MQVYKTPHDAASYAAKKISSAFWQTRLHDMIRHTCLVNSKGSTPIAMHKVKVDRVAKGWPQSGSVTVTRDDGQRFKLLMTSKEFKVEAI
jgi:hypothetical protein